MADETLQPFGFEIEYEDHSADAEPGWHVYLPHQCDAWDIAGDSFDRVPREQAIAELERFIAEAHETLERLRVAPEVPTPDQWSL